MRPGRRRWTRPLVGAAATIALAALGTAWWRAEPESPAPAVATNRHAYPKFDTVAGLAMVVKLDGVRWERAHEPHPGEGDILAAGRFRIAAGRARLSMLTGVVVDVEGPADVELVAADKVVCHAGRLRARVPAGAEGFLVHGPSAAIVDLGTEFGVNVGPDGKMRGQIFRESLEAALLNASGTSQRSYFLNTERAGSTRAFEVDPAARRIDEVATSGDFAAASDPPFPPLTPAAGYRAAVLAARPWGYWRFESLAGGVAPNEVAGRPPLRATGPIRAVEGPGGNRVAEFPAGDPGQSLAMDEPWRPTWASGFAVELWAPTGEITHASLAGMNSLAGTGNHVFLLELTSRNRLTIHKPASIRLLHRFPPGWQGGTTPIRRTPTSPTAGITSSARSRTGRSSSTSTAPSRRGCRSPRTAPMSPASSPSGG